MFSSWISKEIYVILVPEIALDSVYNWLLGSVWGTR